MTVIPQEKIDALLARFETIESDLANAAKLDREEYARLSREHSELSPVIDVAREFLRVNDEVTIWGGDCLGSRLENISNKHNRDQSNNDINNKGTHMGGEISTTGIR